VSIYLEGTQKRPRADRGRANKPRRQRKNGKIVQPGQVTESRVGAGRAGRRVSSIVGINGREHTYGNA